jgi:hypothetical protein
MDRILYETFKDSDILLGMLYPADEILLNACKYLYIDTV